MTLNLLFENDAPAYSLVIQKLFGVSHGSLGWLYSYIVFAILKFVICMKTLKAAANKVLDGGW